MTKVTKATRNKYVRQLVAGEVSVLFLKAGTKQKRRMRCTRSLDMIPSKYHPVTEETESTEVIPVFDLDNQAWRSFRTDSIQEFTPLTK
jgi:WYL_2, Sm-like SH3 beta-barrel fold